MKVVESWLREWVDPDLDTAGLGHELTMLGHEVDALDVEGEGLGDVVVAEVLEVRRHPGADRLSVCRVTAGGDTREVVCGAPNVTAGMKTAFAAPGVTLPNGLELRKTKIRGVVSDGMLCSAAELGLGDASDGILELPAEALPGTPIGECLGLPDAVYDLGLTPNRGDCFSVLGIARDVAALTGSPLATAAVAAVPVTGNTLQRVELPMPEGCPVFAGRVVTGIDPAAASPPWLVERLRRAGLRAIHPVVDVTNYVMLERGQPLHAYDFARLAGTIRPRLAESGETLVLLDGQAVTLRPDTMVVTDDSGVIGLAGVMGGLSTAVTDETTDVYFEAAFWPPAAMAGRARAYGLHTDASLRFERGVDPTGQAAAVERATELLLAIAGGAACPLGLVTEPAHIPVRPTIELRRARMARLLGLDVDAAVAQEILARLGCDVTATAEGWRVVPPVHRFDIEREVDLIEEVARIHGYDRIPETTGVAALPLDAVAETRVTSDAAAALLAARDYREVLTYSFVDPADDRVVAGTSSALVIENPISSEMAVMRSSLFSGLLRACAANLARQQERIRLFEIGKSFHGRPDAPSEVVRLAGLACGPALPEQWGSGSRAVDFFDIKADVEAVLGVAAGVDWQPIEHAALQPGQAAAIRREGEELGVLGKLHPALGRHFGIRLPVYLFELDAEAALAAAVPTAGSVSRFPAIRRDLAVVVGEAVTAAELVRAVREAAPVLVKSVRIFDVYRGPGVEAGLKSVAIGLILQETSRTLTDEDADAAQAAAVQKLHQEFAAVLRD